MLIFLAAAALASSTCGVPDLSVTSDLQVAMRPRPPAPGFRRGGPRGGRFYGGGRPFEAYTAPVEEAPVESSSTEPASTEPASTEPTSEASAEPAESSEPPVESSEPAESSEPEPEAASSGDADVPYFYQYANRDSPEASCQNTSVAMVLKHFGVDITPDQITATFGKDKAQNPHGLAEVFNHFASKAGIPERLEPTTVGSLEDFRSAVKGDDPVIVHGWFTGQGHVVVATDYDGSSYTVNDPAGRWSGGWKSGYGGGQSSTTGDGVTYSAGAFEQAVSTSNGSSFDPMWFHRMTGP